MKRLLMSLAVLAVGWMPQEIQDASADPCRDLRKALAATEGQVEALKEQALHYKKALEKQEIELRQLETENSTLRTQNRNLQAKLENCCGTSGAKKRFEVRVGIEGVGGPNPPQRPFFITGTLSIVSVAGVVSQPFSDVRVSDSSKVALAGVVAAVEAGEEVHLELTGTVKESGGRGPIGLNLTKTLAVDNLGAITQLASSHVVGFGGDNSVGFVIDLRTSNAK